MTVDAAGANELVITRLLRAPRALVWRCWTEPQLLMQWFCPKPWRTTECEIDLRPGGIFRTRMEGPDGGEQCNDGTGVWLEVLPMERLVWTDALRPGWAPAPEPFMTGIVELADEDGGTRYTGRALHKDRETMRRHEEMGFHDGWGAVATQLEASAQALL